jgi:hypothetical protein
MTNYTRTYHAAINHLIDVGVWSGDRDGARMTIARALRQLRKSHGRDRARREQYHMRQICGMFPVKDGHRLL